MDSGGYLSDTIFYLEAKYYISLFNLGGISLFAAAMGWHWYAIAAYGIGAIFGIYRIDPFAWRISGKTTKCFVGLWGLTVLFHAVHSIMIPGEVIYESGENAVSSILLYISIVFGIIAVWFGYDFLPIGKSALGLAKYSFIIYVMHAPVCDAVRKIMLKYMGLSVESSLIIFFVSIVVAIFLCISFGMMVNKLFPRLYGVISGGADFNEDKLVG